MPIPALLAATLALGAPAGPETPLATATNISKAYANSLRKLDVAWFLRHSDPSLVYTSINEEEQNRDGMIVRMKTVWSRVKKVEQATVKVVSAKRTNKGLLVVTDTRMIFKLPFHHSEMSTIDMNTREESLWTKKGSEWVAISIKQLKDDSKVDGRPLLFGFR